LWPKQLPRLDGMGVALWKPYAGTDLDGCRDPETGRIAEWAQVIVDSVNSYTEVSPSETGVKIFARGKLPAEGHKKTLPDVERIVEKQPAVEMYDSGRYFTVTGQHLAGTPTTIEDRSAELKALHARLFGHTNNTTPQLPRPAPSIDIDDEGLLQKAFNAKNGMQIRALWDGNTSAYGDDDSAADCALIAYLAFYTGDDRQRLDRLFRQSGLCREKWERDDYRERTFNKAFSGQTQTYGSGSRRLLRGFANHTVGNVGAENGSTDDPTPGESINSEPPGRSESSWPEPPAPEAYHGLAGDIVHTIAPHTEADPVSILVQTLVAFGNAAGRAAHFWVRSGRRSPRVE
jgi:primase-polymerase (primpol)-like protein